MFGNRRVGLGLDIRRLFGCFATAAVAAAAVAVAFAVAAVAVAAAAAAAVAAAVVAAVVAVGTRSVPKRLDYCIAAVPAEFAESIAPAAVPPVAWLAVSSVVPAAAPSVA